jgi:hypothetical protein
MTTFTTAFKPALNKEGYARLQFIGHEIKSGVSKVTNNETGEITDREWVLLSIDFDCKGVIRGTNQKISITTGLTYSEDNILGKALSKLGYKPPTSDVVFDDEGFEVAATTDNKEGFEEVDNLVLGIEDFLQSIVDKVFIAKIKKATEGKRKGFWEIDIDSLQLFVKPNK